MQHCHTSFLAEELGQVLIEPLMSADPPIITPELGLRGFRNEVFQNITDILSRHKMCLRALYDRQKDQHPLVSSIADIELDASLSLQQEYEVYIKVGTTIQHRVARLIPSASNTPLLKADIGVN